MSRFKFFLISPTDVQCTLNCTVGWFAQAEVYVLAGHPVCRRNFEPMLLPPGVRMFLAYPTCSLS